MSLASLPKWLNVVGIILGLESAGAPKGRWRRRLAAGRGLHRGGAGGGGGGGGRARRALHELLDAHATCDQIEELASVAAPALLEAGGAALLLAAHDAARSGGARGRTASPPRCWGPRSQPRCRRAGR
ncbi:uncharacterized protein [Choristoneura fumiferana]|uniref:uncharacterized protein n=1 Tax=Choristoneura fumiferana TaxID=7141 RepID=UPI003D157609